MDYGINTEKKLKNKNFKTWFLILSHLGSRTMSYWQEFTVCIQISIIESLRKNNELKNKNIFSIIHATSLKKSVTGNINGSVFN